MKKTRFEYKITLIYLLLGGAWILFSDKFLLTLTDDKELLTNLQTYKGWFYVAFTSVLLFYMVKRHLSKVHKAETEAIRSKKLKSAFLQNISHEIRTPMNSIIGFSDILKSEKLSDQETKRIINVITQSSNQLLHIVEELIDISMIETGNVKVYDDNVNLNKFLDTLELTFSPTIKKDIHFSLEKGLDDSLCQIKTDRNKLRQVITNLLNNANKYTNSGSIKLSYQLKDNKIIFYVKDTGIGISAEAQKFVFKRFQKAHNERDKTYEGVGLGLAICKGHVELLNGTIGFISEEGKGSTFYFSIPYKPLN